MFMIKINNKIDNNVRAHLYCPDGQWIGVVENYQALLDVRRQVKEKNKEGYRLDYHISDPHNPEKTSVGSIKIMANGKLDHRPDGFFTSTDDLLTQLI